MKITVNWEKRGLRCLSLSAGLPLLLIAGLIRWRLQWLKDYQAKLASRWDSCATIPNCIRRRRLIDLIRALPVVLLILAIGLILLTMQLNISGLLWAYSKSWLCSGWCLACAGKCWKKRRCGQPL